MYLATQALRIDKAAPLPLYGTAQLTLRGASTANPAAAAINATTGLEAALEAAPGFYDAYKVRVQTAGLDGASEGGHSLCF